MRNGFTGAAFFERHLNSLAPRLDLPIIHASFRFRKESWVMGERERFAAEKFAPQIRRQTGGGPVTTRLGQSDRIVRFRISPLEAAAEGRGSAGDRNPRFPNSCSDTQPFRRHPSLTRCHTHRLAKTVDELNMLLLSLHKLLFIATLVVSPAVNCVLIVPVSPRSH